MFVKTLLALLSDAICFGQSRRTTPYSIPRYFPLLNVVTVFIKNETRSGLQVVVVSPFELYVSDFV